ncbi:unnamed protein product [Citrullus colocynthis]|uniref:Uncharacterized protein n=1 Tax=Citrullus colocynthis TaxID=252529 RepID=A0ABP0YGL5_9ROSI
MKIGELLHWFQSQRRNSKTRSDFHQSAMKKLSTKSFSSDWRQCLRAKCAKRTNPNNHIHGGPFHNSHGSSWFRGALLASVFLANINGDFFVDPLCWCQNSHQW